MFNIDFSTLPEITKKLDSGEIAQLNQLFQDTTIQNNLEEIEIQRQLRKKWKWGIYAGCTLLAVGLSLSLGTGDNIFIRFLEGFFYTIGSGDNSISPVIWSTILSYSLGIGFLYKKFASKIEIPLKTNILSRMCPILYSKLEYSYDEKYSFDELDALRGKSFLSTYDRIDSIEDSVYFTMQNEGKLFSLNGFEIETSEIRGSGKNRRRVTTNHCYLMKAIFPNARIPLTSDLIITTDYADRNPIKNLLLPLIIGIMAMLIIYSVIELGLISIIIGVTIMGGIYYYQKKSANENRVKLENIEFEKLFDVKCEDQVTSRMIITPAFMDRIVQFVEKTGNRYEFLMQNNVMYIKRHIRGTYLEAGTEKNMLTNLAGFVQFYVDMREILLFVNDMNIMYLSKTDTNYVVQNQTTNLGYKPITFSRGGSSQNGFGKIFGFLQFLR